MHWLLTDIYLARIPHALIAELIELPNEFRPLSAGTVRPNVSPDTVGSENDEGRGDSKETLFTCGPIIRRKLDKR